MIVVEKFDSYNFRRYSSPWVARVNSHGKYDFSVRVGGYTGYKGEAGELYISHPVKGQVYAYGQKDYCGGNTWIKYVQYVDGILVPVDKADLVEAVSCYTEGM